MSDVWKELRKRNEKEDEMRERGDRSTIETALYALPALPATVVVTFSDQTRVDFVEEIEYLGIIREITGPVPIAYAVTLAYFALIGFLRLGFYDKLRSTVKIVICWVAWAWFFYSVLYLYNLALAFSALGVASMFMIKIVWWLQFCYKKIREGMFLGTGNDT